jgi:UDP-N-acetylglucosamine 2-epimerase
VCFAPTPSAVQNLDREGLAARTLPVGDIMLDTTRRMLRRLSDGAKLDVLKRYGVAPNEFGLATTHRAMIRENPSLLRNVLEALREMPFPVLLPLHPSTLAAVKQHGLEDLTMPGTSLRVVPPVTYSAMLALLCSCRIVLSDSGGVILLSEAVRDPRLPN